MSRYKGDIKRDHYIRQQMHTLRHNTYVNLLLDVSALHRLTRHIPTHSTWTWFARITEEKRRFLYAYTVQNMNKYGLLLGIHQYYIN